MKACNKKSLSGLLGAALTLSAAGIVQAQSVNTNYNGTGNTVSVRQSIQRFADRYGEIVIVHGALNLNAPVSPVFGKSLSSNNAIAEIAQAAGANAMRVYFVTPVYGSTGVTSRAVAAKLASTSNGLGMRLNHVSAQAAIDAVVAADNADVRFPDGVPAGQVTVPWSLPVDQAIASVAAQTRTHWSVGYIMQSTNPPLRSLTATASAPMTTTVVPVAGPASSPVMATTSTTASSSVPSVAFNPGTTGDSSAAIAPESPQTTSGDSSAAAPDTTKDARVADAVPAGGEPSVYGEQNGVIIKLPPEPPLPRDASGNILPITIHQTPPKPLLDANGKPIPQSQIPIPYYNSNDLPSVSAYGNLGGDPGTINAFTPNAAAGEAPSGLGFVPDSVAFGPSGYNGFGGGFSTSSPNFYTN